MTAHRTLIEHSFSPAHNKYTFRGRTGYIVAPWIAGVFHDRVAIRHSDSVPPWTDGDVHLHDRAEAVYFVLEDRGFTFRVPPLDDKVVF